MSALLSKTDSRPRMSAKGHRWNITPLARSHRFLDRELNHRAPLYINLDNTYMIGRQRIATTVVVIALITVAAAG